MFTKDQKRLGHQSFYKFLEEIAHLHSDKNYSYAHGGPPLGNFDRVAQIMKIYKGMAWDTPEGVAEIYSLKQLDAYLWLKSKGHVDKFEGKASRLKDQAVYKLIQMCIEEENEQASELLLTEIKSLKKTF